MTISQRVFELLQQSGKTQTALAEFIGVRVATVTGWKSHNCDPAADKLAEIAKFFNVSCDYLCTGKEYKPAAVLNQGIFGDKNENNTVNINGVENKLSDIESEIIKVCANLDMRHKNALLTYAYELESKINK